MRTVSVALTLAVPLALSGCSAGNAEDPGPEPAESAADQEEPEEHPYGAGEQITVDLTLLPTDEGGRVSPFFSGYQGTVDFGTESPGVDCSLRLPADLDEFVPGDSHMVVLECTEDVVVHVTETGVSLVEDGDEIGRGDVVFTEE